MIGMAGFFGWISVFGYGIALSSFFAKYFNRKYINNLPKDKENYKNTYKPIMRFIVKYHKIAGIIASIAILIHFYLMYTLIELSISGLMAAFVMWAVLGLGIYGLGVKKNMSENWIKMHKVLSFILILLIAYHIFF